MKGIRGMNWGWSFSGVVDEEKEGKVKRSKG